MMPPSQHVASGITVVGRKSWKCHRGPRGTSWEVILQASFCLLLQIDAPPTPTPLCPGGWPVWTSQQAPFVLRLLVGVYQWEVLAATEGRRRARLECPCAEGHRSCQGVLPIHVPSAGRATASFLPFRLRGGNGSHRC